MTCPHCQSTRKPWKRGFYIRDSDGKPLQRYRCVACKKSFSEQRFSVEFRLQKRTDLQRIFRLLCRGISQRAVAEEFQIHRESVARRIVRFAHCAEHNLNAYRLGRPKVKALQIDELITFEHTKCKPVTVPIAVEQDSRRILAVATGQIPAFGRLAKISRNKYGKRECHRSKSLESLFRNLSVCVAQTSLIKSDKSKHYPPFIKRYFPSATHQTSKGRRGCVVGQGELKRGGFDPLFSLNHSYAMFRDNLKRLTRRTWATTKNILYLERMLFMYAWCHNLRLERGESRKPVEISWLHLYPAA